MINPSLLSPSLDRGLPKRGYSARVIFWVAVLGGPLPAVLLSAMNARAWNRLSRDAMLLVSMAVLSLAVGVFLGYQTVLTREGVRLAVRAVALGVVGMLWLRYGVQFRAQAYCELPRQNPWLAALACTLVGGAAMMGAGLLGTALR